MSKLNKKQANLFAKHFAMMTLYAFDGDAFQDTEMDETEKQLAVDAVHELGFKIGKGLKKICSSTDIINYIKQQP